MKLHSGLNIYLAIILFSLNHVGLVSSQEAGYDTAELKELWNSLDFKKKFLKSYGVATKIEPDFKTDDEREFYAEVSATIPDDPAKALADLEARTDESSTAIFDFTLGALNFQNGEIEKSAEHYKKAIEKYPDFRRAHRNLGIALSQNGEFEGAIKSLTKTIQLGDADALIYGLLGVSYAGQSQHLAAESAFRIAIISEPNSIDWQLGLVRSYLAQEKFTDARKLLDSLLEGNPNSEKLWGLQANVLVQQERFEEALINLELLRDQNMADAKSLYLLGDLYLNDEFPDLALSSYKEAMDKEETPTTSRILRAAKIFSSIGNDNGAQDLLTKLKAVEGIQLSQAEEIEILKLESKMAIASDQGDKAITIINQILVKDPLDGEALIMAGDYYVGIDELEKAMFKYESAAKVEGFQADGLVKQAQIHVQNSDYKTALTLLRKAQQILPRDNIQRYLDSVERLARAASS